MKETFETDPQVVLNNHRPLLEPVYEAFEAALPLARDLMEHQGWKSSIQLFSHLVRAEVKRRLDGKACPVEYDDKIRIVQMDSVAMEGLATVNDGVAFKILKGKILPPPLSDARAYFYQHSNPNLFSDGRTPEIASLVILWECTSEAESLKLYLVCPNDGSGAWLWRISIPPPAQWMVVSGAPSDDGDSDLDISRKEEPGKEQEQR